MLPALGRDIVSKRPAIPVLVAATVSQFAAGVGFWSFNLLAPELAAETGLNERDFGLWITFTFIGTFLSSPFTGVFVRRWGGPAAVVRFFAMMLGALMLVLTGAWWGVMAAALLFGLGYGPQGPVGMTMVTQSAGAARRGLFLSLRHSSQPLAAAVIGRTLPPLMIWAGWQTGVLSVGAVLALALVGTMLAAPLFQIETAPPRQIGIAQRFRTIFEIPSNLRLLWGAGQVFALTQTTVTTFSYLYLLEVAHLSPVAAGIFVSNLHLTALIGRPVLGWLTDRIGNAQAVLAGIALVSVAAAFSLMTVTPETPSWALLPLAAACGIGGQCWNPVFVTAMSFRVDPGDLAELNGRAFSFLSIGWLMASPVVWVLIEWTGGYAVPLAGVALLNLVVALVLLGRRGR